MTTPTGLSFNVSYVDSAGVTQYETIDSLDKLAAAKGGSVQAKFAMLYMLLAQKSSEKADATLDSLTKAQYSITAANDVLAQLNAKQPYSSQIYLGFQQFAENSNPSQADIDRYNLNNQGAMKVSIDVKDPVTGKVTSKEYTYREYFENIIGIPKNSAGTAWEMTHINSQEELDDFITAIETYINNMNVEVQSLTTIANSDMGQLNTYITGAASTINGLNTALKSLTQKL